MTKEQGSINQKQARDLGRDLMVRLHTGSFVRDVLYFFSIGSTNTLARDLARSGEPGGLLIMADQQTAGRGRLGRGFISPQGGGLWFTLLLRPLEGRPVSPLMTLIAGTAACQALRDFDMMDASIKWPNDILIGNRKVAGILAESGFDLSQQPYLVLGIGINLTIQRFPQELDGIATSVLLSTGRTIDRISLLSRMIEHFSNLSDQFDKEGFSAIRPRYLSYSSTIGRDVVLIDHTSNNGPCAGISQEDGARAAAGAMDGSAAYPRQIYHCIDIADDGSLVLQDPSGYIIHQNSGEISLRYTGTIERENT